MPVRTNNMNIAQRFSEVMKESNISMRTLSDASGVPYRSVQNYLSGQSRMPAEVFVKFCDILEVDLAYLRTGRFDISFKESTTYEKDDLSDHRKTHALASRVAGELSSAYDKYKKSDR